MKKHLLKTLLMGVMTLIATGAWAADPDLTNDYTLVKSAEWGDGTNIAGTGACAYTAYDTGNKKQQSLTILTAPEAAAGWIAMQAWTNEASGKGWWNRADNGLYCVNAGRSACVFGDDLTTGWLVVFECTTSASSVMTLTNANGEPDGTFSYVASEDGQKYFCTITAAENAYVGFCGNKGNGYISKISVYKPNKAVVLTSYTVNYVDMDGNTLKESVTYDAIGGTDIALSDADKANIIVGDDTYVYDSDDTEGKTVAEDGSSVVTVKFHKAQNFNYIVNEMCGGTAARVTKSFSYETATVTAPYRKYNAVDGQLYTKGATNKEYNYRFTLTQDNQVENIDYSAVEGVDNVVFLTEGEDVEGLTPCNSANTGIRSSNSASAFAAADTKIVTLGPGTYKLHAIIYDASKNPDSHWIFKAGETEIADFNCTTVNIQEFDSEEFTLTENTDIIMAAAGSNNMGLDALYITGTGEVVPDTYTVAGNCTAIFGTAWDPTDTNNDMVKGEDGIYTKTYEGIELTNGYKVEYKVVKNHSWAENWGFNGNNADYTVWEGDGKYDVTFTFNAETKEVACNMKKAVEFEPIIPNGTYYVMSANEGTLINAENALDAKGTPITFTFDKATNTYSIEGADFFTGKQWTIADAAEGMSGFYTISTPDGFLAVSATMTLEQIADGTADAAVWILLEKSYWEDIVNSTYTIAGTKNLTGTENDWDIVEANQMVLNDKNGLFEKKFKKIAIDGGNQPEFKVVQTNMEGVNTWYPENNWVITTDYVGGEGLYDITITFDPSDFKEVDVIPEKRIVFPENAIVYDFEAAADAGENPANKNGSAGNGQAFYGWENAEKTDSKRQDYKGYEWAEGSVLPEVCHVWRRSDRINGNVADNGGLKCPSNKEMAVDGLKAYDKVIIVYDAENATDKEIIWAIGDGTSDGGPGTVRATATINGVEAVTGETTIASGAEIQIKSVIPAENGTGYIVFQVKKGMIIKQIAIVSMNAEWAEAIAAAQALAEEDGVAVGKLLAAIDEAKGISEPTEEQKAALQTAVDQYKLDNADQEKDETAKVATNGWKKFDGSAAGVCATQYAPAITTYDGRTAQMAECYETNGNRTGTIIYQDITGLTNGKYKVGFYGNAFSTSQRDGFECTMEDGATDVAYVFANEEKEYISARIATSTTENDFRQFDVEVTDGNIKLGMGKDTEKSTNWHTIQIYQLTWFTTAKEVFAQDQEELKAVIAEAKALLADETKTEGKEALEFFVIGAEQAVDSKMINISELEAVIGNMKYLIADFKKANWYIDLTAGDYYIIDVESGLKMAAGHDWGTRGIVNELGLDLTLTPYTESRTVTIDSRVYNGDTSHFLGENLYMDSSEWGWALEYQGFGFYILEPNGGKYINLDADNNLVLSDTPREFIIVTKDGVRAQLLEELSVATKDAPVDATGLITANNFNRNDARNAEAWQWTPSETAEENPDNWNNHNFSGGNNVNNCAESYHAAFNVMQTISGAPAGFYQLTAQGFYRQDDFEGEAPAAPVFFANEVNGDVPAKAGSENSMSDASASFTNGLYTIEPINFEVKDDGMMYIGVTASTNTQWVIWDNFQLKYFGAENPITVGISNVNVETANNGAIYNLNGQKVDKARKGLYIINGKKMIVK